MARGPLIPISTYCLSRDRLDTNFQNGWESCSMENGFSWDLTMGTLPCLRMPDCSSMIKLANCGWERCTRENDRNSCSRSEEHTSELQSLMRISYAVFCLKKKKKRQN